MASILETKQNSFMNIFKYNMIETGSSSSQVGSNFFLVVRFESSVNIFPMMFASTWI